MEFINTISKPVAVCKSITCLCGETITEHRIIQLIYCKDCDVQLIDDGYRIIIIDDMDISKCTRLMLRCPTCRKFNLKYWSDAENILKQFEKGKVAYIRN